MIRKNGGSWTTFNYTGYDQTWADPTITTRGAVMRLNIGDSASYSGTGTTISNIISSPADGEAQTAYDFYTGNGSTSSTYPTYNSAGSASYFSYDGGDYNNKKDGLRTTFTNSIHKNNAAWSAWAVFREGTSGSGAHIIASMNLFASDVGFFWGTTSGSKMRLGIGGASTVLSIVADNAFTSGTTIFVGVSVDEAAGTGFLFRNGSYDQVGSSNTFTATYSSPSSAASTYVPEIAGVNGALGSTFSNGSRLFQFGLHNVALTFGEMKQIYDAVKGIYGI